MRRSLFLLLCLCLPLYAQAQGSKNEGPKAEGFSNMDMLRYCETYLTFSKKPKDRTPNPKDGFDTGLCKGLMYGILHGYQLGYNDAEEEQQAKIACIPEGLNSDHVALAYRNWVKLHPDQQTEEAYAGLLKAMGEFFVCPGEDKP